MEIEKTVRENCIRALTAHINHKTPPPPLKAFASARALILNPSTTDETIHCILQTLVQFLRHGEESLHHHVLKLLSDLALCRDLPRVIFDTIYQYLSSRGNKDADRLTAKALVVILAVAEHGADEHLGCFFHLLCASPNASVRAWIVSNAARFRVPHCELVVALLRFTSDPYPYVRTAALDGLIRFGELRSVEKHELIQSCYDRAVELLGDTNDCVRTVAVRAVSEWGNILAALVDEGSSAADSFDVVFVQICAMVRDMNVEVRTEAFAALGNTKLVSDEILLQTLSKKVTKSLKERKFTRFCGAKGIELPASYSAGVFVHGLEDEFYEVRKSACMSLGKLTNFSVKFAEDVLHLLIDMLNDDRKAVRLQCLQTMHHMAISDRLKVKEAHWHMFLGTLLDSSTLIRYTVRKILRLTKMINRGIFKTVAEDLLTNLSSYPEDEADIFNVLFHIGRSHVDYTVRFVMGVLKEIEPSRKGGLHFDNARVPAILVLAIAASLAHDQHSCGIPIEIFTYAIPFLGRISHAIRDFVSQDTLLSYLSHRSSFLHSSIFEDTHNPNGNKCINRVNPLCHGTSENVYQDNLWDPCHSDIQYQQRLTSRKKEETDAIGHVLRTVAGIWPLIKSGCTNDVQRALRSCKEELVTIAVDSTGSVGLLDFACQYVKVIRLLDKVWQPFSPSRMIHGIRTGLLDLSLEKVDMNIRRLRYGFLGFSLEVELHILDLVLLTCVLKLSNAQICCQRPSWKRLFTTLSCMESFGEKGSVEISDFAKELKLFCQAKSSNTETSYPIFYVNRLLGSFSLKQVMLDMELKQIKAELLVPGNDSENPFPFILGLPAAITFQITLHNVSNQDRLWLRMAIDGTAEHAFLDLSQFEDYDGFKRLKLSLPFYRAPKAASFSVRACVGKECPFDDFQLSEGLGGPKGELIFLCKEKEVYFVRRC